MSGLLSHARREAAVIGSRHLNSIVLKRARHHQPAGDARIGVDIGGIRSTSRSRDAELVVEHNLRGDS